jgi:uroporphyrinogen decarboxylase
MTNRERLLRTVAGLIPDCVPVAPDFSNMIPARRTGKPFWQLYLYNDPPIWEAYIDCAVHFDIDSLMDGYVPLEFPEERQPGPDWQRFIVARTPQRIITQDSYVQGGRRVWAKTVNVYYQADSPTEGVPPARIALPEAPRRYEPLEGVREVVYGPETFTRVKQRMGDQGLVGAWLVSSRVVSTAEEVFDLYDHPQKYERLCEERVETVEKRFRRIMALPEESRPDFLCVGGSGTLIFQSPEVFRRYAFPAVRRAIELCHAAGMPTHVHSCGPETALVKIMAEETDLTVIDPLEIPPMGDCDLAKLKRLYGQKLVLKGNLHTTEVMLRGSVDDVIRASRKAIDDAAAGGRFILSTGDQCGRDTPDENLHAMVETARTYGRY